jgi:hypothetical protein
MLEVVARILDSVCQETEMPVSIFSCSTVPLISMEKYLERLVKYTEMSESGVIVALVYIDRLISKKNFALTRLNVHRLVATAILLSKKYCEDSLTTNKYFAQVAGVSVSVLNNMERHLLILIDYQCYVTTSEYEVYIINIKFQKGLYKKRKYE